MANKTDHEAKMKFLNEFEQWRNDSKMTMREVIQHLGLASSANISLWMNPIEEGKPQIGLVNIKKMSKLSGIKFTSSIQDEMAEYLELRV